MDIVINLQLVSFVSNISYESLLCDVATFDQVRQDSVWICKKRKSGLIKEALLQRTYSESLCIWDSK
jgi:hypothetical protein